MPIGYTIYLSLRRVKVSGLGLGKGARTEVFAGLDNYRAAIGDGEFWAGVGAGARLRRAWCWSLMLGLALLFALLLDSATVRLGTVLPHRDLPAVRGAGRHRHRCCGASSTCPA